ncbi:hypothetical protein CL659_06155 [bacterium]|nr:hypothetical protein [bacterium]|tara:strand:+ start:738 stop:1133 length:396 start_codon:yes stop_codon:yes gene_type:complete
MKIERMNKGSWGKVRAFFDLTTQEGFTIKGFKIIEGINGLFVSMPSQKGNDEEYYDTIWVDSKQLREDLNELAINQYNQSSSDTLSPPTSNENSSEMNSTPSTGDNLSDNQPVESETTADTPAFSDDDIPF